VELTGTRRFAKGTGVMDKPAFGDGVAIISPLVLSGAREHRNGPPKQAGNLEANAPGESSCNVP